LLMLFCPGGTPVFLMSLPFSFLEFLHMWTTTPRLLAVFPLFSMGPVIVGRCASHRSDVAAGVGTPLLGRFLYRVLADDLPSKPHLIPSLGLIILTNLILPPRFDARFFSQQDLIFLVPSPDRYTPRQEIGFSLDR